MDARHPQEPLAFSVDPLGARRACAGRRFGGQHAVFAHLLVQHLCRQRKRLPLIVAQLGHHAIGHLRHQIVKVRIHIADHFASAATAATAFACRRSQIAHACAFAGQKFRYGAQKDFAGPVFLHVVRLPLAVLRGDLPRLAQHFHGLFGCDRLHVAHVAQHALIAHHHVRNGFGGAPVLARRLLQRHGPVLHKGFVQHLRQFVHLLQQPFDIAAHGFLQVPLPRKFLHRRQAVVHGNVVLSHAGDVKARHAAFAHARRVLAADDRHAAGRHGLLQRQIAFHAPALCAVSEGACKALRGRLHLLALLQAGHWMIVVHDDGHVFEQKRLLADEVCRVVEGRRQAFAGEIAKVRKC